MSAMAVACLILFGVVVALSVALAITLRKNRIEPVGEPTSEEWKIKQDATTARVAILDGEKTPPLRGMSDVELEKAVNRRDPK